MKLLFVWTGITPFAGDCWRALQSLPGVELKLVIDAQRDPGREREVLRGLDHVFMTKESKSLCEVSAFGFRPDVLFAVGWHSKVVRAFVERRDWADVPKVQCCDMPWRCKFRCYAARFVLWRYLRRFDLAYVPGRLGARYMRWLGFRRIVPGLLSVDMGRFGTGTRNAGRRNFLYVGRNAVEKRIDLIERAYARYRELGGTWTIDYHHATPYAQLPQVYAKHACLIMASAHDPWPLVMLEAKAAGCEVVASDRCGNGEELGARVVKFGDVEAMAREMKKVEDESGARPPLSVALPAVDLKPYDCRAWARRTLEIAKRVARIRGWCPGMDEPANGMAVVARLLARDAAFADAYVVHGMWLPRGWWRCLTHFRQYVRMTHGSLSPICLEHQGKWKKRLVKPIERFLLRHARAVLATCAAEARWIRAYEPKSKVDVVDIKKYFRLVGGDQNQNQVKVKDEGEQRAVRLLYLGRRHPLKGVEFLERAVEELKRNPQFASRLCFRIVSDAVGEEKEKVWDWCDVLVLPTLTENFGLVIAEALERGKRVITTDGAPAWTPSGAAQGISSAFDGRLVYLGGYRTGNAATRIQLLKTAISALFTER